MTPPLFKLTEICVKDKDVLAQDLVKNIEKCASDAIEEKGIFTIGLSGGSMATFVCSELPKLDTNWEAWRLFFCDERMVPLDSEDSTLKLYLNGLVGSTPLTREKNFIEVNTELETSEAAKDYESKLRSLFSEGTHWPNFDLLLLGVGPDGHTASLFPRHQLVNEDKVWVSPITDSPKPPSNRVTLTLPAINNAKKCIMAFAGEGKKEMVKELKRQFALPSSEACYPAAKVRPVRGEIILIMDEAASS